MKEPAVAHGLAEAVEEAEAAVVTATVYADGDDLRVELETPEARLSAPFELPESIGRSLERGSLDLFGKTALFAKKRGLSAVPGFGPERPMSTEWPSDERLGPTLFQALFPGRLRSLLDGARQRHDRLYLRLAWDVDEPRLADLHRVPWELLSYPETSAPLALEPSLGLARSPRTEVIRPALEDMPGALRVVAVAANPRGTAHLQLTSELEGLLALCHENRAVEIVAAPGAADLHTVRRLVQGHRAHVLHFMGHGDIDHGGSGVLLLEDARGDAQRVTGDDLALALQGLNHLRLIVLNACRTGEAGRRGRDAVALRLIESGVPAVIAMQAPVPDSVAVAFSTELYGELARGRRLERAVCEARHGALARAPSTRGWAIPVLFSNVAGKTLAGLDEQHLPAPDRILRHRYLKSCVERCSRLDGDRRRGLKSRPLRSVYGRFREAGDQLMANPGPSLLESGPSELAAADGESLWLWQRLLDRGECGEVEGLPEILKKHRQMLWLGAPGSGKTQLLRWLTRQHAEAALAHQPLLRVSAEKMGLEVETEEPVELGPTRIPVLIDLLAFSRHRSQNGPLNLAQWLGSESSEAGRYMGDAGGRRFHHEAVRQFLLRELRRGRALLLADRLDEIVDPDQRFAVAQEAAAFIRTFDAPAILVGRPLTSARLALASDEIRCFQLEPLNDSAVRRLGREYGADEVELERLIDRLRKDGADELIGNPLTVSVLTGLKPTQRRIDLYGPIVEALLDRYPRSDRDGDLEKLGEIAAFIQDRPTHLGLIAARRLSETFGELDLGPDGLGPLQPLGADTHSFVGRPIQDYLAARWLASEAATLEDRLIKRLDEPAWRRPAALALGMAAEILERPRLQELFQGLLRHDQEAGNPIPTGSLLILKFRPELPAGVEPARDIPWFEAVKALLSRAVGEDPSDRLDRALIEAIASRLRADDLDPLDRALTRFGQERPDRASVLAQVASMAPEIPVRLVKWLASCERSDSWIDPALRALHNRDPTLLEPGSANRLLRRDDVLAQRIAADGTWRRILRAVLGHHQRPFRASPLDAFFLDRIRQGADSEVLRRELRTWAGYGSEIKARHARLALTALGEVPAVSTSDVAVYHQDLRRIQRIDCPPPRTASWTAALLDSQRRKPEGLWIETVRALADRLPADHRLDLLLRLAAASKESCKSPLLADFWRCLLWPKHGDRDKTDASATEVGPVRRAAVVLDRYGRFLTTPTALFVNAWIALGPSPVELPPVRGESFNAEHLACALDVLAQIPDGFDFVRAWALAVLRPELRRHGLLDEAVILAETTLSDRLDALTTARRRLLGTTDPPDLEALAVAAAAIEDPWRRYRALNRLSQAADLKADWVENRLAARHIYLSPTTQAFYGIVDPFRRLWAGLDVEGPARTPRSSDFPPKQVLKALAEISGLTPEQDPFVLAAMAKQARRAAPAEETTTHASPSRDRNPPFPVDPLLRVERGELSPHLVDRLIHQMDHGDDLSRLRARLALHGDRTALRRRWPIGRIGSGAIFRLAEHWLQRRYEPGAALILRWTFQAVVHDRPDVMIEAAGRAGDRRRASVVLRFLETVSRDALPAVREILRNGSGPARRALIRGLCNVLAVDDRAADELRRFIGNDLAGAAAAFAEQRMSVQGLAGVIDAASGALGAENEVEEASRLLKAGALPWSELLTDDRALDHLRCLGQERRVGASGERQVKAEAKRVVEQPALLPLCIDWLLQRLNDSTLDDVDDLTTRHLVHWIASAARRRPRLYLSTIESRRGWVRRLAEQAEHGVWLSTRRSAIKLLSLHRRLDDRRVRALWVASSDVPEVQRAALESLAAYRRVDDLSILEPVEQALDHERPFMAYAAARLLAALAGPANGDPRLRRRIEDRLRQAAGSPDAKRTVHQLKIQAEPLGLRIVEVGRLDRLLRGLLLDIQNPFFTFDATKHPGADP